jgi:hypothetical protein
LRKYNTESQIFGGEPTCEHSWEEHFKKPNGGKNHPDRPSLVGANNSMSNTDLRGVGVKSDFCVKCGAWKGELGLEPNFELFISHLIDIFNEVKRVLKKEGVCFVNLGDTYIGSPAGNKEPTGFQQLHQDAVGVDYLAQTPNLQISKNGENSLRGREQVPKQNLPDKCLAQIPSRFAIAMTEDKYVLRDDLTNEEKQFVLNELIKRNIIT